MSTINPINLNEQVSTTWVDDLNANFDALNEDKLEKINTYDSVSEAANEDLILISVWWVEKYITKAEFLVIPDTSFADVQSVDLQIDKTFSKWNQAIIDDVWNTYTVWVAQDLNASYSQVYISKYNSDMTLVSSKFLLLNADSYKATIEIWGDWYLWIFTNKVDTSTMLIYKLDTDLTLLNSSEITFTNWIDREIYITRKWNAEIVFSAHILWTDRAYVWILNTSTWVLSWCKDIKIEPSWITATWTDFFVIWHDWTNTIWFVYKYSDESLYMYNDEQFSWFTNDWTNLFISTYWTTNRIFKLDNSFNILSQIYWIDSIDMNYYDWKIYITERKGTPTSSTWLLVLNSSDLSNIWMIEMTRVDSKVQNPWRGKINWTYWSIILSWSAEDWTKDINYIHKMQLGFVEWTFNSSPSWINYVWTLWSSAVSSETLALWEAYEAAETPSAWTPTVSIEALTWASSTLYEITLS